MQGKTSGWPRGGSKVTQGLFGLIGLGLLVAVLASPAGALTYTVTTASDTVSPDSQCSLREAILAANNDPSYDSNSGCGAASAVDDTITFDGSISGGTITLTMGTLPAIVSGQGTLTIDGGGNVTISGDNSVRVMEVNSGADLTLRNLTIESGRASPGGGALNDGTLRIENSTFRQNAAGIFGGGVRNNGTLTITNSTFSGNRAGIDGGGVENRGTLTITGSTFSGNSAGGGGGVDNRGTLTIAGSTFSSNSAGIDGGGVRNNGTLTITNSTFSGNSAGFDGGGVENRDRLTITGSTFSGNSASFDGGGVRNRSGTLTIANSTFSGNNAGGDGGGVWSGRFRPSDPFPTLEVYNSTFSENQADVFGGGLRIAEGDATLSNTIVANSTGGGDCVGSLTGANLNNLIEDTGVSACGLSHGDDGNIIGQDPQLDPLFGSPAYYPLQLGSPARDAGDPGTCSDPPVNNQSQNGITRPQDGDGDSVAVCDIGSFEALGLEADMMALGGAVPSVLAPGGSYSLSFSCRNFGPDPASQATCGVSVSAGSVSGVSCTPSVPTTSPLPAGERIDCTFTYTAPGTPGGSDTPETGAVFTFTAGSVTSDPIPGNNTFASATVPLVDALDDAGSLPGGSGGATFHVGANDQLGASSPPAGATYSLLGGTTCGGASVNSLTGLATFDVPMTGTCVVVYQVCVSGGCDNAQLVVTALAPAVAIPTLQGWGLVLLLAALGGLGTWMLRRMRA